ncbi:bifunctional DNA primase/polymerase [Streptomyces niveus]|uniref:bifunctional DNA primase/polymerase n=1 Tax=Streptomyces niveus TaxID=193462 RepID=UPI003D01C8A8
MRLPSSSRLKAAALDAAARGWRVFPLAPGTDRPAVRDWELKATNDEDKIITAWNHGPYNIGLVPCASSLLVLDLIPAAPGERPPLRHRSAGVNDGADVLAVLTDRLGARFPFDTFSVATPDRGLALYFTHPQGRPCPQASATPDSPLGWHIAIRSSGTFVPLPGSIVTDGSYEIAHDGPARPWPAYLAKHLSGSPASPTCLHQDTSRHEAGGVPHH